MSCATPSACACPTPVTTEVPGSPGNPGTAGTNGINSISIVQQNFVVPNIGSSVTVLVDQQKWMNLNQNVFVAGAGTFSVASLAGTTACTLTYLNYTSNTAAGNTINAGTQISPGGFQASLTLPLTIANGGTGAATKANAQADLGLGQTETFSSATAIGQAITASAVSISGVSVTVPAAGLYLIVGHIVIDMNGVTFAASRTITLTAVDTTSSTTLATRLLNTQTITTISYPSATHALPVVAATLANGDTIQLQVVINTINSAGTLSVSSANLGIIPLALS